MTKQTEPRRVRTCALLCRRPLLLPLGAHLRSQLGMSLPNPLGLPGSSHFDSEQEQLIPNWFEERSESAQLVWMRDALWSKAWPPLPP